MAATERSKKNLPVPGSVPMQWQEALSGDRVFATGNVDMPRSTEFQSGDNAISLAVPRRGHVLSTVVESYSKPVRDAVAMVTDALASKRSAEIQAARLSPRTERPEPSFVRAEEELAAWALVSMWIVGVASNAFSSLESLDGAERWFRGKESLTKLLPLKSARAAEALLRLRADAVAYYQLLPYILDPHGPGSRLSINRDSRTRSTRFRKRKEGIFYTPADVAEYMAGACLPNIEVGTKLRVFDPACGTGVFLRAAIQEIRRREPVKDTLSLASECIFGTDVDPWPLDAAAFVLLADSWTDPRNKGLSPVAAWRSLRTNLACVDTLRIDPTAGTGRIDAECCRGNHRISLSQLFPAMEGAPNVILGNPPYANLGSRSDLGALSGVYETLRAKPRPTAEICLPFLEQMIRLAQAKQCSGALVLPLSLAFNSDSQFAAARGLISRTPGNWRFAFFDREPHALFGEDVKVRNAIVLWSRTASDKTSTLATGPLQKWRGETRATMFKSLRFTPLEGSIRAGIPKVDGVKQAEALSVLTLRWGRLEQMARSVYRLGLADAASVDDRTVLVGSTAYNFLNVFMKPTEFVFGSKRELSENPLHAIKMSSRKDALAVFGILSSRLTYWWWHAVGDGFHVSKRFITGLPFGAFDLPEDVLEILAQQGAALWAAIERRPIISSNRGRVSLAYSPVGYDDLRRRLDEVLVQRAGLRAGFVDELGRFTASAVAAAPPAETAEDA